MRQPRLSYISLFYTTAGNLALPLVSHPSHPVALALLPYPSLDLLHPQSLEAHSHSRRLFKAQTSADIISVSASRTCEVFQGPQSL